MPILFTDIGRWWGTDSKTHQQAEIDLVARDGDTYLFCECKWRKELLDSSVLAGLREKANIFGKKQEKTYFFLFSRSGFTKALLEETRGNENVILVSLADLLERN